MMRFYFQKQILFTKMIETQRTLEQGESKYRYSLITGFTCVNILSSDRIVFNPADILRLQNHIGRRLPGGISMVDQIPQAKNYPIIDLILEDKPEASLEMYDSKHFKLSGPFQRQEFYSRLPYIAYNAAEKSRQEALNMSSLHAAAVATRDGRSLLILGDKGSGKTLLSLVCGLYCNLGLIGNDLILTEGQRGQVFIKAGTQIFDV